MTFTEVAFELADPVHPLCRFTAGSKGHAIYRVLDAGEFSRRHRAHLSLHAPTPLAAGFVEELRGARPETRLEVLDADAMRTSVALDAPLEDPAAGLGLAPLPSLLQSDGLHGLLDPIVASDGRLKVRLVVPRRAEAQELLRTLQDAQRACGFSDFRIARIAPLAPSAHIELARRALPPEQEALLALAASMGYYASPKSVTLEGIARSVGLSISPVHKRLKAAEETIVAQHVSHALPPRAPRRSRVAATRADPNGPWELRLRVRGDIGPSAAIAQVPGARASLHLLSSDGGRVQSSILVLLAPDDAQEKLLAAIEDRAEVAAREVVERSPHHAVCRLTTRDRGPYALGWWCEAWGTDAALRSVVLLGGEAHIRALLTRAHTPERLAERLDACARAAGWIEWELVSYRSLAQGGPPPSWPAPLTQRQLEVLRVAHALGYYRTPRGCTLEHVARTLGVSANAVHKNLVLAESKLITAYLASGL